MGSRESSGWKQSGASLAMVLLKLAASILLLRSEHDIHLVEAEEILFPGCLGGYVPVAIENVGMNAERSASGHCWLTQSLSLC